MNSPASVKYFRDQIVRHARLFLDHEAARLIGSEALLFTSAAEAIAQRGPKIVIPVDINLPAEIDTPWFVPFGDTTLTLWHRIPLPSGDDWSALPNANAPAWYRHSTGTMIPAWNLYATALDLLTAGEERRIRTRDHHGRFAHTSSPRHAKALLGVPSVNEAVALIVAALRCLQDNSCSLWGVESIVRPPVVIFSHDCDLLAGNDRWTQAVRLYRFIAPVLKLRLPRFANIRWLVGNMLDPHRYYFDNATGMRDIEHVFGATSTFYILNGSGGRYGARNSFSENVRLLQHLSADREVGMHYNYDTFLNETAFSAQLGELQRHHARPVISGRAHYLRFDSKRSFSFLSQFGIEIDESSGWSTQIGYRNGLGGCYQAYDSALRRTYDIWEVPLVVMEDALVRQHGDQAVAIFEKYLKHLRCLGGAISFLIHPGQFNNPEHPSTRGLYHEILRVSRRVGAISLTAQELVSRFRSEV